MSDGIYIFRASFALLERSRSRSGSPPSDRPSVCLSVWLFTKMLMLRAVDASFWFTTMASRATLSRLLCFCNHRRRSFYFCCLSFTTPRPSPPPGFVIFTPRTVFAKPSVYVYMCARSLHCAAALAPFHYCFHLHPFAAELLSELKSVVLATASRRRVFLINPPPRINPPITPPLSPRSFELQINAIPEHYCSVLI